MSVAEPARHLQAVETGEVPSEAPQTLAEALAVIAELEDDLAGAETEKRSWRTKYQNLKRDKQAEAQDDALWGVAVALFWEWRVVTGHMRSQWSADRFFLCKPYLETDTFPICRLAIWGIAANPNTRRITANYVEVYDSFELAFRDREKFERYVKRGWAIFGKKPPQDPVLTEAVEAWLKEQE